MQWKNDFANIEKKLLENVNCKCIHINMTKIYMLHRKACRCLLCKKKEIFMGTRCIQGKNEHGHYHTRIQEMIPKDRESYLFKPSCKYSQVANKWEDEKSEI